MHRKSSKKASMELSVNSIVILVIAVVMMGLILGFIRSKFSDISKDIIRDEPTAPEATSSDPITMSRTTVVVNAAQKTALKLNFFNTGTKNYMGVEPSFECKDSTPTITGDYFDKEVSTGTMASFEGTIKTGAVAKDTYLCKVCILGYPSDTSDTSETGSTCTSLAAPWENLAEKEFTVVVQ
jgi:hypothetical protein